MKFAIGGSEHERVEVAIIGYEHEPGSDYYSDNWLQGRVSVSVGGFIGRFEAAFLSDDFSRFLAQLNELYESLTGKAEFSPIEGQLLLTLESDGRGHIHVQGEAADRVGTGNCLIFTLEIDQTQLAQTFKELKQVVCEFPIRSVNPQHANNVIPVSAG